VNLVLNTLRFNCKNFVRYLSQQRKGHSDEANTYDNPKVAAKELYFHIEDLWKLSFYMG
jgi:hypothetical protein